MIGLRRSVGGSLVDARRRGRRGRRSLTAVGARPEFARPARPPRRLAPGHAPRPTRSSPCCAGSRSLGAWWLLAGTAALRGGVATRGSRARCARCGGPTLPAVRRVRRRRVRGDRSSRGVVFAPRSPGAVAAAADASRPSCATVAAASLASLPPRAGPNPHRARARTGARRRPRRPRRADRVATEVVVAPGDNLWELAARTLARATGRDRAPTSSTSRSRRTGCAVCDRNRATLRSGDPNLIFPGEVVVLPPVS